jgi:Cytochrome P460
MRNSPERPASTRIRFIPRCRADFRCELESYTIMERHDRNGALRGFFVVPDAYRLFLQKGTLPDKTILVLEAHSAQSKGSINKQRQYQNTTVMGLEFHVKDEARFRGNTVSFRLAPLAPLTYRGYVRTLSLTRSGMESPANSLIC